MANCSDNSYIIYYTNLDTSVLGTGLTIQIQKSALITDELDIALIGKTRIEYGEIFNENVLHLLENFALPEDSGNPGNPDTSQAYGALLSHPTLGQVWFNKTQQRPFVCTDVVRDVNGNITSVTWSPFGSMNDVAGNSGVIAHGQQLPLPVANDGYTFDISECAWTVSPFNVPQEIDFIHCFSDPVAIVTMQYRFEGQISLNNGYVNYQIIGIKNNNNLGTIDCQSIIAPTSTPVGSPTPTPTPTLTMTITPTITPTVTVTTTATPTPTFVPSATPTTTATPTPTGTPGATVTPTATLTPTVTATVTPTLTPTRTVTPTISVTPTGAVNSGEIFAIAARPFSPTGDESYYLRRIETTDDFDASYVRTVPFPAGLYTDIITQSSIGKQQNNTYFSVADDTLFAYAITMANQSMYGFRSIIGDGQTYKPSQVTADDNYVYVAGIDITNAPTNYDSEIRAYDFSTGYFVSLGNILLPNTFIVNLEVLANGQILVTYFDPALTSSYTYAVVTFNGTTFTLDANDLTLSNGTENVAALDEDFIAIMDADNVLRAYSFLGGTGFTLEDSRDYSTLANGNVSSMKWDVATSNLIVAYRDITTPTSTVFEGLSFSGGTISVVATDTFTTPYATNSLFSIAVRNSRVLAVDVTDPVNTVMNWIEYDTVTGFTVLDTLALTPANRAVDMVDIIIPEYGPVTPTPTPTPTATVTPTISVTPSVTTTVTPTITPSVTPSSPPPSPMLFTAEPDTGLGTTTANITAYGPSPTTEITVDWGDGVVETFTVADETITHNYTTTAVFNGSILINGTPLDSLIIDGTPFTEINDWGNVNIGSNIQFFVCSNLTTVPSTLPSYITGTMNMFSGCASFNQDISGWDVSNVTNMNGMFENAATFNQNLNTWDVSNVTNFSGMFRGASAFNGNISGWVTTSATETAAMFENASAFNQDLSGWNVSLVTDMYSMFLGATVFNGNVTTWNVGNVTNFDSMFASAPAFNQNISAWNTASATQMGFMFSGATIFNQDISGWDVSNVTNMNIMFQNAAAFNQDLSGWCVTLIPSEPINFAVGASAWVLPQPVWGTCP